MQRCIGGIGMGGLASEFAKRLALSGTPDQRKARARKAALARWSKARNKSTAPEITWADAWKIVRDDATSRPETAWYAKTLDALREARQAAE
jgi:hypothetical protein